MTNGYFKKENHVNDKSNNKHEGNKERQGVHSVREKYAKSIDYLFVCCGNGIGFGNVWKFPFLCYKNGGGAFLIPYFLACFLIGIPMFLLESSVGQFMSEGGMGAWKIAPLFQGIGLATTVIVFLQSCTYTLIIAWSFYYFFASFTTTLPWSHCNNDWNTGNCLTIERNAPALSSMNRSGYDIHNQTFQSTNSGLTTDAVYFTDPVTEYWERKVLGVSDGIENIGGIKWDMCLCLLLSWVMAYFVIWKGLKVSGKIIYVTVIAPYLLMTVLLIRGLTLDGAIDGIEYYLKPNIRELGNIQVWADAGYQVTFSYALGAGIQTALGSYNDFHHRSHRDIVVYAGMNSFTSLLSGFIIFSVLGFMAKQQNVHISEVAESGPGLSFIAYPEAVAQLPGAPVWSALFFMTLLFLGVDSQFGLVETFITAVTDMFPQSLRTRHGREVFAGAVCVVSFLLSLPMVTNGGVYVFLLVDFYVVNNSFLIIILLQVVIVAYIYGINRFLDNIEMMYGRRLPFIKVTWTVLSPLSVLALLIFGILTYTELTYEGKTSTYHYPGYCRVIGWLLTCSSIACLPGVAVYRLWEAQGTICERIRFTLKPILKKHQVRPGEDLNGIRLDAGDAENLHETCHTLLYKSDHI